MKTHAAFSATDRALRKDAKNGGVTAKTVAHLSGSIYASYLRGEANVNLSFMANPVVLEQLDAIRGRLIERYGESLVVEEGPVINNHGTIIVRIVFSD